MRNQFFITPRFRYLIVLLFILLNAFSNQAKAQMVLVPDSNFRNALIAQGFGSCFTGNYIDSTCALVVNCHFLDVSNKNIQYITGMEAFKNLKQLNCRINYLTNLQTLPISLTKLSCGENQLINLPTLPDSLATLDCSWNHLTNLPSLPNSLTDLYCSFNQLTNLPTLPNSLAELNCGINALTNLPTLPNSLTILYCNNNQLTNLPTLPNSLTKLSCGWNHLINLPPLPNSLATLECNKNQLINLPTLPNTLTNLDCDNNQLTNLPTLPNSLIELYCYTNQLTNLPTLPNSLDLLSCGNNQLTKLPTLPNPLYILGCDNNQLTNLPTLPNSLTYLNCDSNPNLSCLPELKNVKNLNFRGTGVTCLPNYGHVTTSQPLLSTIPLCGFFNPYGCISYWNISGKTYFDADTNCVFNNVDFNESNFKVNLYKNGNLVQQAYTGKEGYYSFDTDSLGVYKTQLDTTGIPFLVKCPVGLAYADTLAVNDTLKYDRDFALKCKNGFDLGAWSIYGNGFVPGHVIDVNINAGDYSNQFGAHCASGIGGVVKIFYLGDISFVGPAAGTLTPVISGDTLIYYVSDFGLVNSTIDFNFSIKVDTNAVLGSQVCFDVSISPATDNNPSNNFISHCYTIIGSFDPNEKEVSPESILDIHGDRWLTYTISFQNTGTAPAEHIYILDTLDANLDLSTFQLLAYNHQPYVQILEGGIAKFNFPNINLPDSVSDEPHSHGYVQYKIKAKGNLPDGFQIANTAYIYFDFNVPVITNTVTNTILNCPQSIIQITQLQDTLSAPIPNGTYQWINCTTNNIIQGEINQTYVPTSSGNYSVIVITGNCTDTSACHFISLTSLNETYLNDIQISPNPSNDEFVVYSPQNVSGKNVSITIFDAYGKLIEQKQLTSNNTLLKATSWSKGIYFMQIDSEGNRCVKKLVKK